MPTLERRRRQPARRPRRLGRPIAVIAAGALVLAACGDDDEPAQRTEPPGASGSDAELQINYMHPDAGIDQTYTITCDGATSTVTGDDVPVDAEPACAALDDPVMVERLVDGPPPTDVCTEIYGGPDTAEIEGTVADLSVDTRADRVDGCAINDWDNVLAPLLPPPVGVEVPTTTPE